jgi:hypothetical protein
VTPQQFIAKWQAATLSERSACQQHFLDLCELLGQPKPAAADPEGAWYCFERGASKTEGSGLRRFPTLFDRKLFEARACTQPIKRLQCKHLSSRGQEKLFHILASNSETATANAGHDLVFV